MAAVEKDMMIDTLTQKYAEARQLVALHHTTAAEVAAKQQKMEAELAQQLEIVNKVVRIWLLSAKKKKEKKRSKLQIAT